MLHHVCGISSRLLFVNLVPISQIPTHLFLSLPFSSTEEMMDNESGESMKKEVIGTAPGLKATRTQGHRSKGHRQKATGQKATRTEGHGTKGHCTQGRI